jgi:hypothetical protein
MILLAAIGGFLLGIVACFLFLIAFYTVRKSKEIEQQIRTARAEALQHANLALAEEIHKRNWVQ